MAPPLVEWRSWSVFPKRWKNLFVRQSSGLLSVNICIFFKGKKSKSTSITHTSGRPTVKCPQQSPPRTANGPLPGLIWRDISDNPNRQSPFITISTGKTRVNERPREFKTSMVVDRARLKLQWAKRSPRTDAAAASAFFTTWWQKKSQHNAT